MEKQTIVKKGFRVWSSHTTPEMEYHTLRGSLEEVFEIVKKYNTKVQVFYQEIDNEEKVIKSKKVLQLNGNSMNKFQKKILKELTD